MHSVWAWYPMVRNRRSEREIEIYGRRACTVITLRDLQLVVNAPWAHTGLACDDRTCLSVPFLNLFIFFVPFLPFSRTSITIHCSHVSSLTWTRPPFFRCFQLLLPARLTSNDFYAHREALSLRIVSSSLD